MGGTRDALAARLMRVAVESKQFGETAVLGPVAFEMGPGEALGLLGPSGVGKTTLLRIIAGLETDYRGRVDGAGRIGHVFQEPTLLPWRTARENVMLAAGIDPQAADAALAEVGLAERADAFPGMLSLGQARRVALARAFGVGPETLLLDEPFVSLDPEGARRMQGLLAQLMAAHPVRTVLVTHSAEECARLCDRVLTLGGAPARIASEHRFEEPRAARDESWIATAAAKLAGPLEARPTGSAQTR